MVPLDSRSRKPPLIEDILFLEIYVTLQTNPPLTKYKLPFWKARIPVSTSREGLWTNRRWTRRDWRPRKVGGSTNTAYICSGSPILSSRCPRVCATVTRSRDKPRCKYVLRTHSQSKDARTSRTFCPSQLSAHKSQLKFSVSPFSTLCVTV